MINEIAYKKLNVPEHYDIREDGTIFNMKTGKQILTENKDRIALFDSYDVYRYAPKVLIATKYVPNPHNYIYIDFIDGDSNNISASNLKWSPKARTSVYEKILEYFDSIIETSDAGQIEIINTVKKLLKQ